MASSSFRETCAGVEKSRRRVKPRRGDTSGRTCVPSSVALSTIHAPRLDLSYGVVVPTVRLEVFLMLARGTR